MKAVVVAEKMYGYLSPYLVKKALEQIYGDPNFRYVLDKIVIVKMPKKTEDGLYVDGRYLISFHVKSTQRVGKPVVVKPIESHIRSLILTYDCSATIYYDKHNLSILVTRPTDKDRPQPVTTDLGELELSRELTKNGKLVIKVVDGHVEDGVLDLKTRKPYVKKNRDSV